MTFRMGTAVVWLQINWGHYWMCRQLGDAPWQAIAHTWRNGYGWAAAQRVCAIVVR